MIVTKEKTLLKKEKDRNPVCQSMDVEQIMQSKMMLDVTLAEFEELNSQISGAYKYYKKSNTIISEGDRITSLNLIISGVVDVVRMFPDGDFIYVNKLKKNSVIGIEAMYEHKTYRRMSYYYYNANTDVELYNIPMEYIREPGYIRESIQVKILGNLLAIQAGENYRKQKKIDILYAKSLRERIYMYLCDQREKARNDSFRITLNREEMAKYLGVNRSALSAELSKMKAEGILDYHRNHFELFKIPY